jgi:hypothetical protein
MKRAFFILLFGCLVALGILAPHKEAEAQVSSRRMVTVLASAERITTTTSSDITNLDEAQNIRGGYITLDVTEVTTTPIITLSVEFKDPVSGEYETLLTASSGVNATGTHTYLIYPGAGTAGADVTQVAGYVLPQVWRVSVEHDDTDPIEYSVGAMLAP